MNTMSMNTHAASSAVQYLSITLGVLHYRGLQPPSIYHPYSSAPILVGQGVSDRESSWQPLQPGTLATRPAKQPSHIARRGIHTPGLLDINEIHTRYQRQAGETQRLALLYLRLCRAWSHPSPFSRRWRVRSGDYSLSAGGVGLESYLDVSFVHFDAYFSGYHILNRIHRILEYPTCIRYSRCISM